MKEREESTFSDGYNGPTTVKEGRNFGRFCTEEGGHEGRKNEKRQSYPRNENS